MGDVVQYLVVIDSFVALGCSDKVEVERREDRKDNASLLRSDGTGLQAEQAKKIYTSR